MSSAVSPPSTCTTVDIPTAIRKAADGDGTVEQRKALLLDLYTRLQTSDPSGAAATVLAHETRVNRNAIRNKNIAGSWDLFDEGGDEIIGSVSFSHCGRTSGQLQVECEVSPDLSTEDEFLDEADVVPQFDNLNVDSLVYKTSHRVCGDYFDGELTINVIDEDNFDGELNASAEYDVNGSGDMPYGLNAVFFGKRRIPTPPMSRTAPRKKQRT